MKVCRSEEDASVIPADRRRPSDFRSIDRRGVLNLRQNTDSPSSDSLNVSGPMFQWERCVRQWELQQVIAMSIARFP
jgi:hypothetical protein